MDFLLAPLTLLEASIAPPLIDNQPKRSRFPLQLVHLPGTFEIGLGLVGGPLSSALSSAIPGTTTKAITYNTCPEFILTVAAGARAVENYLGAQVAAFPNQRFVLSGYSKGALVLHAMKLNRKIQDKIVAILVFGDPARSFQFPWQINAPTAWPINSPLVNFAPADEEVDACNVASFCNHGDMFSVPLGLSLVAHLSYATDGSIYTATEFVKARV